MTKNKAALKLIKMIKETEDAYRHHFTGNFKESSYKLNIGIKANHPEAMRLDGLILGYKRALSLLR
jgi:hypothetical protein